MTVRFTEPLQVYLTVAQKNLMHETATRNGLSDAAFARQAILHHIAMLQQDVANKRSK